MTQTNPIVKSNSFGSFVGFVMLMGFVMLVNWAGGFQRLIRKARRGSAVTHSDGTSSETPSLVLLQGGKA